MIFSRTTYNW